MLKRTDDIVVIIDTREQAPLDFGPDITCIRGGLATGDYSMQGFEDLITIERKELSDLVSCVVSDSKSNEEAETKKNNRARFERELLRMRSYRCKAVMIEATLAQVEKGGWRSQVKPASVLGSIAAWRVKYGVEFIYAGSHALAAGETLRLLRKFRDHCADAVKRFL